MEQRLPKPGRPAKNRVQKLFYLDPDLELMMNRRLAPDGGAPPKGATTEYLNNLIRRDLEKGSSNG